MNRSRWIALAVVGGLPLAVALLGWGVAYARRNRASSHPVPAWQKRLYVFFLNRGYFEEMYEVFIARPTLAAAHWMWQRVDRGIIDRLVESTGALSLGVARGLVAIDIAIDRQVTKVGTGSVGIARGLAVDPDILLMDEPFGALDAITRTALQDEFLRIWQETGKSILFVTHDIEEAVFLGDRVLLLGGKPAHIVNEYHITIDRAERRESDAFLQEVARVRNGLEMAIDAAKG